MKRPNFTALASFALAAAVTLFPEAGCVDVPDAGKKPILATHVADWREEVIYQLIVDRFENGDVNNDYLVQPGALARYQGGDWKGIENKLGYLQELGVTTIWISPVVKNVETDADVDAYHGYWAQDLTQTNPHFGDMAQLRKMVAAAHERGMKVVLDVVTNHMGQLFFYDMNMNGKPDVYIGGTGQCIPGQCPPPRPGEPPPTASSPVVRSTEYDPDWDRRGVQAFTSLGLAGRAPLVFIRDPAINRVPPAGILGRPEAYHGLGRILNYEDDDQRMLGDFPGGLKDVATELPEVREEMTTLFTRWAEQADLDGFRIDTVKHVEHGFWQYFAPEVRKRLAAQNKKNFFIFGEAFDGRDELLGSYTAPGELDSVFYFSQAFTLRSVFGKAQTPAQQGTTLELENRWKDIAKYYSDAPQENGIGVSPRKALVNFLDNHDISRFLFEANGDRPALRNALTLIFTEQGIPCLYYGTEQDFAGGNDPANREILWTTGHRTDGDTFRHIAKLARLRKQYRALTHGDTTVRWSTEHKGDEEDAGIFAFERAGGDAVDRYALVVLNTSNAKPGTTAEGSRLMPTARPSTTLVDVLDPARATYVTDAQGNLRITVPPQKALILVPQDQVVP